MTDFPNSPTLNQEFTAMGRTWRWNGTAWQAVAYGTQWDEIAGKPVFADVATSGSYTSLIDLPIDLDKMFKEAQSSYYHEINYTISGDISDIQVYTNISKTVHLYSRVFTYDGSGNITTITTTDQQVSGVSLSKTITYNGSGSIATVTRNYYGI